MLSKIFIPCASRKYFIHNIWGIRSSTQTSSDLVELFLFSFCLLDAEYRAPCPIDIIPPVWLFVSWCTVNAASTHHFTVTVPSDSRVSTRSLVPLRYFSIRNNFLSLSSSSSLTCVLRKSIPVRMSVRTRLHRKIIFATMVWSAWASFSFNFCVILLTSKRWFTAGVIALP